MNIFTTLSAPFEKSSESSNVNVPDLADGSDKSEYLETLNDSVQTTAS